MSKVLKVSKSGYYKWFYIIPKNIDRNAKIKDAIKIEFKRSMGTYGSPRIYKELCKKNIGISKSTTGRIMK